METSPLVMAVLGPATGGLVLTLLTHTQLCIPGSAGLRGRGVGWRLGKVLERVNATILIS